MKQTRFKQFIKYGASSLSSCAIDLFLFAAFCRLLSGRVPAYIAVSTVMARVLSASYNYAVNHKLVFESGEKVRTAGSKYVVLAAVQMGLSAALVSGGKILLPSLNAVLIKAAVDSVLFVASFFIQRSVVFKADDR